MHHNDSLRENDNYMALIVVNGVAFSKKCGVRLNEWGEDLDRATHKAIMQFAFPNQPLDEGLYDKIFDRVKDGIKKIYMKIT